jgi:CBS domain-containing protein
MEIEELEVFDFLKNTTPLDNASDEEIINLIAHTGSFYRKRGSVLELDNNKIYLIHKGAISIEGNEEQIIAVLAERDFFGFDDNFLGSSHIAKEDSLCYILDKKEFFNIFADNNEINNFFVTKQNSKKTQQQHTTLLADSVMAMSRALDATFVQKNASILSVAKIMQETPTTAVLVMDNDRLLGIITDRAFCTKVVAGKMDYSASATEIMTADPIVVEHYDNGVKAMLKMAKAGVRHLPIVKNDKVVGILTAADLLRKQSHNVVFLLGEINQAKTVADLVKISKHLPHILTTSVDNNLDEHDIAYSLSTVGRSITTQLIKQFEEQHGTAPTNYAFVIAGSQARGEQILHSDQDNLMILSNDYDEKLHSEYFTNLAKYISDGLNKCGYVYCPGEVMATTDKWRAPLKKWQKYFAKWIKEPEAKALMYASIFFDMKCIYGDKSLLDNLTDEVFRLSKKNRIFLSHMAANANQYRPPLGFFRNFILDKNELKAKALDMKKKGITPIVDLARVYAISNGVKVINTIDRLNALIDMGGISKTGGRDLIEAYKIINLMRIKHQANQIKQDKKVNNYIEPIEISPLAKKHLKDAFKMVEDMQDAMENSYQSSIL